MKTTDADFPVGTDADVAGTTPQVRIARISERTFAVLLAGKERARFSDLSAAFFCHELRAILLRQKRHQRGVGYLLRVRGKQEQPGGVEIHGDKYAGRTGGPACFQGARWQLSG